MTALLSKFIAFNFYDNEQHRNLFVDICNMARQDQDKFGKVYDDMYALRETWVDKVQRETMELAEQKAYEKEVNLVLKMINKNCEDEFIQDLSDFSLEEIAKIREEHLNS